ncbi:MAG TPA: outer membrane protein assembly factor BamA [Phycisphaerae bacterium]|nr:outer membrane protein assembly factor BamA [Phycisphaerae bacterium]
MPVISPQRKLFATDNVYARIIQLCGLFILSLATLMPGNRSGAYGQETPAVPQAGEPVQTSTAGSLNGWPISKIELVGNNSSDRTLILNQIRVLPGQNYDRAQVEVDVRSIASLGRFVSVLADVIPEPDHTVVVRYVVQERTSIKQVVLTGNRDIKDSDIIHSLLAQPGGAMDPFVFQSDIKTIQQIFQKKGFLFCQVTIDQQKEAQGIVNYMITEGPKIYITKVDFVGNNYYPRWYLKFKVQTAARWKLFWLIPIHSGAISQDNLDTDLQTLRTLWTEKGFLDCRTSYSLQFQPDFSSVTVQFIINPGVRYKIGKITIEGNTVYSESELASLVTIKPGMYFDQALLDQAQKSISDHYGVAGYIYCQVSPSYVYTTQPGIVDIVFDVTEGQTYHVGQVIIRGNTDVQDHVVRRAIRLYPGEIYNTVERDQSVQRIQDTGLFPHAIITPIGNEPDTRDALVNVDQGQTAQFVIGAGVSSDAGLIGQISMTQKNFDITDYPRSLGELLRAQAFKGNGQYFQIMLEPGTVYQLYQVSFAEPYLFDSPYSFRNDLYYYTETYNDYDLVRPGDRITVGRRFSDQLSVSLAFRWELPDVTDVQTGTAQQIVDEEGYHYLSSITPGIVYDSTDSQILPTKGFSTGASLEQYGLMGGDFFFTKINAYFTWYKTVYTDLFDRPTVFMLRNNVGFVPWGNSVFYERFYAGGIGSLRGFTYQGVTPREGPNLDGVGGNFLWVTTGELNFPLWQDVLRAVTFVDVGDVESNVSWGIIRLDAGAGFRIKIPFFGQYPLGVDFAYPLIHGPQDHLEYISFALGLPM